tara:strand:+ start:271 stop:465 length:195 start_codon:yes stop_codon:yes gene_type:complete
MTTLKEIKSHFAQNGLQSISNEVANYQFVKREDGVMFQFSNGVFTSYNTLDGLCKAALYKIKRG